MNAPVGLLKYEGSKLVFLKEGDQYRGPKREEVNKLVSFIRESLVGTKHEWDIVVSDTGALYDVLINRNSVGYFSVGTLIDVLGLDLSRPELLYHGPVDDPGYSEVREAAYLIPLFGIPNVD